MRLVLGPGFPVRLVLSLGAPCAGPRALRLHVKLVLAPISRSHLMARV